jgi:hypothetical protein
MTKQRDMKKPSPPLSREEAMAIRAAADSASMDAANSRPIDLGLLEAELWMSKGGSCGFSWNGVPIVAVRRRVVRRRKQRK